MFRVKKVLEGIFIVFFLALCLTDLALTNRLTNLSTPFTVHTFKTGVSAPAPAETPGPRSVGGPLLARAGQEDVDYPSGLQHGDDTIPDKEFPSLDDSTDNPFNPFKLDDDQEGPDENSEDGEGSWWKPWTWGKLASTKISQWIWSGINNFLLKTIRGAYKSVMKFLTDIIFQDINLSTENRVTDIYRQFAWMVGGVFVFLIVVLGIKTTMGTAFGWNNYRLKIIAPRIILGAFAAIFALPICQVFINMVHSASISTLGMFKTGGPAGEPTFASPTSLLWDALLVPAAGAIGPFIFILLLFALIGFVFLAIFYVIRKAGLIVLAILSPLAFALWIDESTSTYTTLWTRAFFALVFVEFIHALIIVIFFQTLTGDGDIFANVLYCYALLYLMYKIPAVIFSSTVIHWGPKPSVSGTGASAGKLAAIFGGGS